MVFSKFKDKSRRNTFQKQGEREVFTRVRLPRGRELLGVVEQRYGGAKMLVKCTDKPRNCRIPGRLKRALWIREGDIILIEPWEFDNDKGDILFKYNPSAIEWLKRKGYLGKLFEF